MPSRLSILRACFFIFVLALTGLASEITPAQAIQEKDEVQLDQFDMLTPTAGWILLDQHLFWTSDAGQTWIEISPSIPAGAEVQDVSFLDSNTGWLLWTLVTSDASVEFQLAHTLDHGASWTIRSLPLFDSGEIASYAEAAEMDWLDAQTGWISVKQSSGSNFSLGSLFTTTDGGSSWERYTLPVADHVTFSDLQVGWAIGGPAGDQIFETKDAGATWQDFRPDDLPADMPVTVHMPFSSGAEGLLVLTYPGTENGLRVYSLDASSDQWLPVGQVGLDVQASIIGLSILDSRNFVATIPGTPAIVRMIAGELERIDNQDGLSASIVELDMVSADVGWAKSVESSCTRARRLDGKTGSVSCSYDARLLQTNDGGRAWRELSLPLDRSEATSVRSLGSEHSLIESAVAGSENTEVLIGQGFDKCEIPTIAQLQTWRDNSPYAAVNLYIGGSSRACANSALTLSSIKQIYQQGWKFIPTWVGPQAPCTAFRSRFGSDVTTAYNQGNTEANLAVERLAELGLTNPDKTGSVVYYDIENYGTDANCRSAVNAFMNGWVSQLHVRGNLAGVYGSTLCNTGLSDFRTIANVPDVIWPARWYHGYGLGYYDPDANVWNLGSCVPNTVWANHQRIRQYEGDHSETWGSLTLEIDSNVLDGVVAIPNVLPFVDGITRLDGNPTSAATVSFNVTFSEPVTDVDANDFILEAGGSISGEGIEEVSGSGNSYTVRVNTGSGAGSLRLDVPVAASITDPGGNGLDSLPFTGGETYTIEPAPGVGSYDDIYSHWVYNGSWTAYNGTGPMDNTSHYTHTLGNSAELRFTGTRFILTYSKHPSYGSIDVFVDGTKVDTINTYNPTLVWRATWASPFFAMGTHSVRLVHAGAAGKYIEIDAIQILDTTSLPPVGVGTYEDTDNNWVYSIGGWTAYTGAGPSSNNSHYARTVGDSVELTFTGTRLILTYARHPSYGSIDVFVDGARIDTINSNNSTLVWRTTWASPYYPLGTHTMRFVHAGPAGKYIDLDAIQILNTSPPVPVGTGVYEDTNSNWVYSGAGWTTYNGAGPTSNTSHYTRTVGDAAELTFTGVRFILSYTRYPSYGLIDVYVDGTKVSTINSYSPTLVWRAAWTSPTFPAGTHTVRFVHAGAVGKFIELDAIQILDSAAVPPGTYDDADSNWVYSTGWTAYITGGPANNTGHYTSTVGNYAELTFTGTNFTLMYAKYPSYGMIDVYVDGTKIGTIDTYSPTLVWRATWSPSAGFPAGAHTVRLVHAGDGTYIDIDAISILP